MTEGTPRQTNRHPLEATRKIAGILLALYVVSSLFEGYVTIPGLSGHSIFSLLQRPLVVLVPFAVFWMAWRGDRRGWPVIAALTIWLGIVIMTFLAFSPHTYYYEYYLWTQLGGYSLVLALWLIGHSPGALKWTATATVVIYVLATISVGLWETITRHHLGPVRPTGTTIPTTFYFDQNSLGAAVALILPFLMLLGLLWPRRLVAIFSWAAAVPLVYLLYKTGSRGGEIALLLEAMALPWVLPRRYRRWSLAFLGILGLTLVAVVATLHFLPEKTPLPFALVKLRDLTHLVQLPTPLHQEAPSSLTIRTALLQSGLEAIRQHPFGLGPRGAERYYLYWVHHPSPYNTYGVIDAHNMWLENAIDFGYPGLLFYTLFYALLLVSGYRLRRHPDRLIRYLSIAVFVSLIGFIVGSLSPSSVMIGFHIMWVIYGLGLAAQVRAAMGSLPKEAPSPPG